MKTSKKILVTGAAGFIGFHLVKKLLERGDTVVGLDNINDYYDVNLKYARLKETGIVWEPEQLHNRVQSTVHKNYSFVCTNLEDKTKLMQLFAEEQFDAVCNLAAQAGVRYSLENPQAYISSNIVGFVNILEACRHFPVKHLVYASSSSVYGNNTKMPLSTADNVDHPISLYAATKKSNELMAHTYSHLFGLPTTGLRFFTVYGPWGRPDMALFIFTKAILEGKPIQLYNNGNMVRDFTYVDDIVEGVVRIIENPPINTAQIPSAGGEVDSSTKVEDNGVVQNSSAPYKVYNIGNSSPVPITDFIDAIEYHLGKKAIKEYLPMQPGDVPYTEADVSDLVKNLGYKPNTPVTIGIKKFIDWYKLYYNLF